MIPPHALRSPSLVRAIGALGVGAVVGGLIVAAIFGVARAMTLPTEVGANIVITLSIFLAATLAWSVGLVVLGAPLWALAHRLGLRTWWAAAGLGMVLCFLVLGWSTTNGFDLKRPRPGSESSAGDGGGPTLIQGRLTPHGWRAGLLAAAGWSLAGGVIGLAVWRTAYRRAPAEDGGGIEGQDTYFPPQRRSCPGSGTRTYFLAEVAREAAPGNRIMSPAPHSIQLTGRLL